MAISIGSVILPDSLQWPDRFNYSPVAQSHALTLGGQLVTFESSLVAGRNITLEAVIDQGWLTKKQVDDLKLISDTIGNTYTLTYDTETFTVIFDHSNGPAVNFSLLVPRPNAQDTDYMIGTIKLLTV